MKKRVSESVLLRQRLRERDLAYAASGCAATVRREERDGVVTEIRGTVPVTPRHTAIVQPTTVPQHLRKVQPNPDTEAIVRQRRRSAERQRARRVNG